MALEAVAAKWLAREPDPQLFTQAMTAGLPGVVHSPRDFVARRLRDKLPPHRIRLTPAATPAPARRGLMECTDCGRPGRPDALPGGLCRGCRVS